MVLQVQKSNLNRLFVNVQWIGGLLLYILLFLIFLQYFGLPSWQRYQEGQVVVTSHKREDGYVPAPAVTFCPQNPSILAGFKNTNFTHDNDLMGQLCEGEEDIKRCIEEAAYNLTETIDTYSYGDYMDIRTPEESAWNIEFGLAAYGLCYTLNISFHMTIYNHNGTLMFNLNDNLTYIVFVYDPNVFVQSANPSIPMQWFLLENDKKFRLQSLSVVEHQNMV